MKILRSPFLWLGLVCLVALWWAWPRGGSTSAAGGGVEAVEKREAGVEASVPAPTPASAPAEASSVKEGAGGKKREEMGAPREFRPMGAVLQSLLAQAQKSVETGAGGADEATKAELVRRTKEIEALRASGRGPAHPNSVVVLAEFSWYLDHFGNFDAGKYKEERAAFFGERLKELQGLPEDADMAALLKKWQMEQPRDDSATAILLRRLDSFNSNTKEKMEGMLKSLAQ
ncbi:MAG TPA: hypothetical protein VGE67_10390 [Haloferula sp.]